MVGNRTYRHGVSPNARPRVHTSFTSSSARFHPDEQWSAIWYILQETTYGLVGYDKIYIVRYSYYGTNCKVVSKSARVSSIRA